MKMPLAGSVRRALFQAAGSSVVPIRHRAQLLARLGHSGIDGVALGHGVTFCNPSSVHVGAGSFINNQAYFDVGPIQLGTNVTVGPRAMFLTGIHEIGPSMRRAGDGAHRSITVGDGAWIGAGAIILPGVAIGAGCIVGAGAVVTADCLPNSVYAGVPARKLRDLDPNEQIEEVV
ncbi:acyltransferase [Brachybacterium muris]|uniref:acyltransferase n=1 Tax=Brachybacterium muris TaxID=219301 RepID=UPI0023EE538D|nr:DapH/DapD/GlmU-related protein [Brachybacterium muris]